MKERDLYEIFKKKLSICLDPRTYFYYKIPDSPTGQGGNRPFDAFLVYRGVPWAIEFKSEGNHPTAYQSYHLDLMVRSGGRRLVITAGDDIGEIIEKVIVKGGENGRKRNAGKSHRASGD